MMPKPIKPKTPKTYPVEPDKELLLWEKWIKIRKEETTKLGKYTRRPPADLVSNLYGNVRPDKERKTVLEEAAVLPKVTVRGGLWDQPERLKQKCSCDPVYEFRRTPAELGRPKIIEHIDVPTEIQVQEMGYTAVHKRNTCNLLNREYHKYRDKRENELEERIKQLDPFRPEISTLMIRGRNPPPPPIKIPPLPCIEETLVSSTIKKPLMNVYALRINNTIFIKDEPNHNLTHLKKMQMEPWHENCTSWTYYFNIVANRASRSRLYLQNLGTVTIKYCWKKIKKAIPFIPEETRAAFFFNKNEGIIVPGEEKYIYFTFLIDMPGVYKEYWELNLCNVSFMDTILDKLLINLLGDSVEHNKMMNVEAIQLKSDISKKLVLNYISELIEDVISKSVTIKPEIYPYKDYFLEREIFVMKNPVCFYHQTEVMKMKELYAEMRKNMEWDLSITTWRELMMTKEFTDRMNYYELLRKSYRDLLKPWYEGESLVKSKYRAMNMLWGLLADKFDVECSRLRSLYNVPEEVGRQDSTNITRTSRQQQSTINVIPSNNHTVLNLFYIHMYEHVGNTIESCAGILSSLDLDRWIKFDFCKM